MENNAPINIGHDFQALHIPYNGTFPDGALLATSEVVDFEKSVF